ncbi:MAG: hypothetical protein AB8C02_13400 [Halioglobus sp.]
MKENVDNELSSLGHSILAVEDQIAISVGESDRALENLVASILSATSSLRSARNCTFDFAFAETSRDKTLELDEHIEVAVEKLQTALVDLQFYDRLSQRLALARLELDELAEATSSGEEYQLCDSIVQKLRSLYTSEQVTGFDGKNATSASNDEHSPLDNVVIF